MPKTKKTFDKAAYDAAHHKEKYKNLAAVFTKEEAEEVELAAKRSNMTRSTYIKTAVFEKIERDKLQE